MSKEALVISEISAILKNVQYGSIVITIHDGEVTQVDTTEKKRFSSLKKPRLKWSKLFKKQCNFKKLSPQQAVYVEGYMFIKKLLI